jgi:hypothetical protein
MTEPAKRKYAESEAAERKSTMLTAQLIWAAHAWNSTPQEATQQVVADLFEHLLRGGSVTVHIVELDGKEHTIEVTARRR